MRAVVCDVLEGALSAAAGSGPSLADVEPILVLAEAFESAEAYAGFLTTDVGVFAVGAMPDLTDADGALIDGPRLAPYIAAATGVTLDDETSVLLVALLHGSADDAVENASRLREVVAQGASGTTGEPWSDLLTVADTSVDGPLLLARLETAGPGGLWYRLVAVRDTLLAWG
jgi:hypothetical protein